MVKAIALIRRKPGTSRAEFRRHYEEVHAPLTLRMAPGIVRYVRNHVVGPEGQDEPPFDCITEVWYGSKESFKASMDVWSTEAGRALWNDQDSFMDRDRPVFLRVEEVESEL